MNIGDKCWYWDRDARQWVAAVIFGKGHKNDHPVYDVRVDANGDERWGYQEQVKPR